MTRGWEPGCSYGHGDVVEYEGCYYRIVQPHSSQSDWTPDRTPALWGRIPEHEAKQGHHGHQQSYGGQQQGYGGQQQGYGGQQQGYGGQQQGYGGQQQGYGGQQQGYGGQQQGYGGQQQGYGGQQQGYGGQQQGYGGQQQGYGGQQGYGQNSSQQSLSENQPKKPDGFNVGGFHISDEQMKIGGGLLGTAAALGIGAFAFDKYKDAKEEKKDSEWASSNWEVDAHRRQGEYLEAVRSGRPLPPIQWVLTEGSNIPEGAIPGGKEADGEILYIARVYHEHGVHVGKVSRKMKEGCHIAYGGKEITKSKYEILLGYENRVRWVDCQGGMNLQSEQPVEGGREADGKPLYIAQAFVKNGVHPGKCGSHLRDGASIAYGGDEKHEKNYRVLVNA